MLEKNGCPCSRTECIFTKNSLNETFMGLRISEQFSCFYLHGQTYLVIAQDSGLNFRGHKLLLLASLHTILHTSTSYCYFNLVPW